MKKILCSLFLFGSILSFSQEAYEYVIVPHQFEFFKKENQYNLNALTKSFFESQGFTVFYDNEKLPSELANNRCDALMVNVIENSKLFTTNMTVELKDCQNNVVFESAKGTSREKDYNKAYNESLRAALTSMKGMLQIKNTNSQKVESDEVKKPKFQTIVNKEVNKNQLFALPTTTGYKLVDSQPVTVMVLYTTSSETVFIAEKDNDKGVFIKKINGWYFEYYQNEQLISEKVEVKF